jgi:hypothetical protein
MLRRMFASDDGEITGGWKELPNQERRNLNSYYQNDEVKVDKMDALAARMGVRTIILVF